MITKQFSIWWLLFLIQCFILGFAYIQGYHLYFWENDFTYLSSGVLAIWALASCYIGYETFKQNNSTEFSWFVAESCMTIGMIGTVVGFVVMLKDTFINIDPSNIETMRVAITAMSSGMSTALLTTLAGLVASLFLKIQLINQDSKK
jgi:hypothetical protein